MTSLYTVQGGVSLDMPASLLRPDTSKELRPTVEIMWRLTNRHRGLAQGSTLPIQRKNDFTAIIAPTAWSWWWCSTSATQCRAKWAVHSRAAATVTARSSVVKLYLVIGFVLQIRCLSVCAHARISGRVYHTYTSENKLIHSLEA